tara:strand:+ start:902 stop:1069 length:168 start_codon:yes stop_codon:yes gene_type:complete
MKEYKIVSQKSKLFKNSDLEFEKELNELSRQGWNVQNSVFNASTYSLKVILEREK